MRTQFTCLLLILCILELKAQVKHTTTDSLLNQLKIAQSDTTKYEILKKLYNENSGEDDSQTAHWVEEIKNLTNVLEDKDKLSSAYLILADYETNQNRYIETKKYNELARDLYLELGDTTSYTVCLFNLGLVHDQLGDYLTALEYYQKSLHLYEQQDNQYGIADALANIAVLYSNQLDYHNSVGYFKKALSINEALQVDEAISLSLGNIGAVYHDMGVAEQDTSKMEMALDYYERAMLIQKKTNDAFQFSWLKSNMGLLFNELGKYDDALKCLDEALEDAIRIKNKVNQAAIYGNIGEVYYNLQDYNTSLFFQQKCLGIAQEISDKISIMGAYESISNVYKKQNKFEQAYDYHVKFKAAQDSLYNSERNAKFNELIALYDAEKKEKEIEDLQHHQKIQELQLTQQRIEKTYYIVITVFMAALAILIYLSLISKEKNKKQLEKLNAELIESKAILFRLNETKDRFFAIIAHDLRGAVTSFQGIGQVIKNHLNKNRLDRIDFVADRIDKSASQLNNLLDNLLNWAVTQLGNVPFNPRQLKVKKLVALNVEMFADVAKEHNVKLNVMMDDDLNVTADQNALSVVIRNLLSNALKFTQDGGTIDIMACQDENQTTFAIQDNGMGIPTDKIDKLFVLDETKSTAGISGEKGTGLGLLLCMEFVKLHNGDISVESTEGEGSTFTFFIPNLTKQT